MILARADGPIAVISLNRPDKRNAMTPEMLSALRRAIADAAPSRALLLTGEGKVFCGGFDLKLCLEQPGTLEDLLRGLHDCIQDLRSLPIPVVIAAHSAAIAGGCALLGGADFIVTDAAAKLGYPVLPLGISPAVSAPFLRLLVGDGHARARLLDPALISGREALSIGLVSDCTSAAPEVLPRALEIARALADKPPAALSATRAWLGELEESFGSPPAAAALHASLALAGSDEERDRLRTLFAPRP